MKKSARLKLEASLENPRGASDEVTSRRALANGRQMEERLVETGDDLGTSPEGAASDDAPDAPGCGPEGPVAPEAAAALWL